MLGIIIPTDFHFFRGVETTKYIYRYIKPARLARGFINPGRCPCVADAPTADPAGPAPRRARASLRGCAAVKCKALEALRLKELPKKPWGLERILRVREWKMIS